MIGDIKHSSDAAESAGTELDNDISKRVYGSYFGEGCHPTGPKITVNSVELKLREHLDHQGLGAPITNYVTVASVLDGLTQNQGGFVQGDVNTL